MELSPCGDLDWEVEPGADVVRGGQASTGGGGDQAGTGGGCSSSRKASALLDILSESKLCLRWSGAKALSSWGSEIAEAAANRDSSSEKIILGRVARRRRGGIPPVKDPPKEAGDSGESGERWVSASWRFSADSGLLRFESRFKGGGTAKNGLLVPVGPDLLTGSVEKVDS